MANKPKYKVGQRVSHEGTVGIILKVIQRDNKETKYFIDFIFSKRDLLESLIEKI